MYNIQILVQYPTVRKSKIFDKNAPVRLKLTLQFVWPLLICFIKLLCPSFAEMCLVSAACHSLGCVTPTHRRDLSLWQENVAVCLIQTNEFKDWNWGGGCLFRDFQSLKLRSLNIRVRCHGRWSYTTEAEGLLLLFIFLFSSSSCQGWDLCTCSGIIFILAWSYLALFFV